MSASRVQALTANVPSKKNLLTLAGFMPNFGVGGRVFRRTWSSPDSYWLLTRVERRPPGSGSQQWRGKAYGVLYWRGQTDGRERRVTGVHKPEWRFVSDNAGAATGPALVSARRAATEPGEAVVGTESAAPQ